MTAALEVDTCVFAHNVTGLDMSEASPTLL